MMKKRGNIIYLLLVLLIFFVISGCGGDDDDEVAKGKLMVLTSRVLQKGESYKLYRGSKVRIKGTEGKYYVAPLTDVDEKSENITLNLEFEEEISEDLPFVITKADEDSSVVIAYNPSGSTEYDVTTEYGSVLRMGGGTQQLRYGGLHVAGMESGTTATSASSSVKTSEVNIRNYNEKIITLSGDEAEISGDEAATEGESVNSYEFIWHSEPDHRYEYYTDGDASDELTETEMLEWIDTEQGVYIAHDVRYMTDKAVFSGIANMDGVSEYAAYYTLDDTEEKYIFATLPMSAAQVSNESVNNEDIEAFAKMTHSTEDAYTNPVLHIVEGGAYRLRGSWNGQVMVDVGGSSDVTLILDGVNISCTVGPAIVFRDARECGPTENVSSFDVARNLAGNDESLRAGAAIVIADGSVNNIKGSNLYRLLKAEKSDPSVTIDGSDISAQNTMYKMDGAIHSSVSLAVLGENTNGGGRLNITSTTYDGLASEFHMVIDSGMITVTAEHDGISVKSNDTSVFAMNGGSLKVISKKGDGIASKGWIVINNGALDVTAAKDNDSLNANEEGPLNANLGVYMSDSVTYTHQAYEVSSDDEGGGDEDTTAETIEKKPVTLKNSLGYIVLTINYETPVKDEDKSEPSIPDSGEIFRIHRKVNSFSGIKYKENN